MYGGNVLKNFTKIKFLQEKINYFCPIIGHVYAYYESPGKQESIHIKGVLNKTGKRRCDCDETGYFISCILLGVLNYKGSY